MGDTDTSDLFDAAAAFMPDLVSKLNEEELLYLYARFKQATVGSCNKSKPRFLDFQGKKKWNAWKSLGDMTQLQARTEYVLKIQSCDPSWNSKPKRTTFTGVKVSRMAIEEENEVDEKDKSKFDFCKEGLIHELERTYNDNDVLLSDDSNRTLLHWACDRGHFEIVKFLLDKGSNVNTQDIDLLTPLHYSVQCGYLEIVKLLLLHGADPNLTDNDGDNVIDCADSNEIKMLLRQIRPGI